MGVDKTSGDFTFKTRDQDRSDWIEDFKFRIPNADVGKDSQAYKDASVNADANQALYANASIIADGTSWSTATGTRLRKHAEEIGRPAKDAVGSQGFVVVEAAAGGGTIPINTEIKLVNGNIRFKTTTTKSYVDGDLAAIEAIDTGAETNLPADTVLTWQSPPPGILGTAKIYRNQDDSGTSGGAPAESDDEIKEGISEIYAEPASSGNDADVIQFGQKLKGIGVQKMFCTPCMQGPGEYAVCFTMRPASLGASRLPNNAQLERIAAELEAEFPGDDGIYVAALLDQPYVVCLEVVWLSSQTGFEDSLPWPPYNATKVVVSAAAPATASTARLNNCTVAPSVGKNIAFYDATSRTFKVKRIATIASLGGNVYNVTFDLTGAASDLTFVPAAGAIVSPWCANMSSLVEPLLKYNDKQGPGEMVSTPIPNAGRRQRRIPESTPTSWPNEVTTAILNDLFPLTNNVELLEPATPFATTVGTPGVSAYLHRISDIGIFAP